MSSQPPQYLTTMKAAWKFADGAWATHGPSIAGEGYKAIHAHSVQMSHPPLPVFLYILACCVLLCNGATVYVWGKVVPIALWVFNVNYSQTRKSCLTRIAERFGEKVDGFVQQMVHAIAKAKADVARGMPSHKEGDEPEDMHHSAEDESMGGTRNAVHEVGGDGTRNAVHEVGGDGARQTAHVPKTWSVAFLGGTLERCKARCAGDFNQIRDSKFVARLPALTEQEARTATLHNTSAEKAMATQPGMSGSLWQSRALIFDESYDILMDLSLLDTPSSKKGGSEGGGHTSGQRVNAGWANRLMQYGKSDHETKTAGCHGGAGTSSVDTSVVGNLHPGPAVEMHKGLRGDHGCQTKARLFFATGTPVQPHDEYEANGIAAKREWCPLPEELHEFLGLADALATPRSAADFFDHDGTFEDERPQEELCFPNEAGWPHVLPDGARTAIRYNLDASTFEWSVAVRDFPMPEECCLDAAADRLSKHFLESHRNIDWEPEARRLFNTFCAYFQIQVWKCREVGDIGGGAQKGTCPWKLAMLSGALFLWDLMWKQTPEPEEGKPLLISAGVVRRGHKLLEVTEGIVAVMAGEDPASERQSLRARGAKAGADEARLSARLAAADPVPPVPDMDFEPAAQATGIKDMEFARRLLFKGKPQKDAEADYEVPVGVVHRLLSDKELQTKVKPTVHDFRHVSKAIPSILGKYDTTQDALIFHVPRPEEVSQEYEEALESFANLKHVRLRTALLAHAVEKRGGAKQVTRNKNGTEEEEEVGEEAKGARRTKRKATNGSRWAVGPSQEMELPPAVQLGQESSQQGGPPHKKARALTPES